MIDGFNPSRMEGYGCEESKEWEGKSYGLSFTQKNQSLMTSYTKDIPGKWSWFMTSSNLPREFSTAGFWFANYAQATKASAIVTSAIVSFAFCLLYKQVCVQIVKFKGQGLIIALFNLKGLSCGYIWFFRGKHCFPKIKASFLKLSELF